MTETGCDVSDTELSKMIINKINKQTKQTKTA